MNVELFEKIKTHVREEPKRLYMGDWVMRKLPSLDDNRPDFFPECGTVACMAGWAVLLNTPLDPLYVRSYLVESQARKALDIDGEQASGLFYVGNWPKEFLRAYTGTEDRKERAEIFCSRIDHFLQHGE